MIDSSTAHLIIKNKESLKRKKVDSQITSKETKKKVEKDLKHKARLDSMLEVLQAREKGQICRKNILKMDSKVNASTQKILENKFPKETQTLKEQLKDNDYNLPRPKFHKIRPLGPRSQDTDDLAYWKRIPAEVKKDEVKRMHSFFFNSMNKFESANENIKPLPIYSD